MILRYIPLHLAEYYAWNGWYIDYCNFWSVVAIKYVDENWHD